VGIGSGSCSSGWLEEEKKEEDLVMGGDDEINGDCGRRKLKKKMKELEEEMEEEGSRREGDGTRVGSPVWRRRHSGRL